MNKVLQGSFSFKFDMYKAYRLYLQCFLMGKQCSIAAYNIFAGVSLLLSNIIAHCQLLSNLLEVPKQLNWDFYEHLEW